MTLKSLDKLLNSGGNEPLENLIQHAQKMDGLLATVRQALPEVDPREIVAANRREDADLIVVCRSPAWAARLRFESERILQAARLKGHDVSRCRIRVQR